MSIAIDPIPKTPTAPAGAQTPLAEYCQALLHRLGIGTRECENLTHAFGLTSCTSGEGVTTVACQTAACAAAVHHGSVVLVDCNLVRPAVHRVFNVSRGPGLQNALRDPSHLQEYLQPAPVANLSLLTVGETKERTPSLCGAPNLGRLFETLKQNFDLVIVDCPAFSHGLSLEGVGTLLDGVLLVVEAEKVRWEVAQRATASLTEARVNLLGVVMNKRPQHVPNWLYRSL
jgi:Mrp family chromosome partitioning ATPase